MLARKSSIEILRVILLLMVVSIHVSGPYLSSHFISGVVNWQVANILDGGSRVAVGCFVVITGYFLSYSGKSPGSKPPSRRIARLLAPLGFYFPLYLSLYRWGNRSSLAGSLWAAAYDLGRNDGLFYHMWYVQVIAAVYLLSPYLNSLVVSLERRALRDLIIILGCITSVLPTLVYVTGVPFHDTLLLNSRLVLFVTLYLTGGYIRAHKADSGGAMLRSRRALALAFLLTEVFIIGFTFLYNSRYSPLIYFARLRGVNLTYPMGGFSGAFYDFNSVPVVVGSVLLFLLFLSIDLDCRGRLHRLANKLGACTYGAYLGHVFWIQVVTRFIDPAAYADGPSYPLAAVGVILSVSACSMATEALRQAMGRFLTSLRRAKAESGTARVT